MEKVQMPTTTSFIDNSPVEASKRPLHLNTSFVDNSPAKPAKRPATQQSNQDLVRKLFRLPSSEVIFEDFSCALYKRILLHGRMFLTENYICFYSKIFGFETKEVIPLEKCSALQKTSHGIEIRMEPDQAWMFASFADRSEVYSLIETLWKRSRQDDVEDDNEELDAGSSAPGSPDMQEAELELLPLDESKDTGGAETEILRVLLPCNVQKFFATFFADNAVFPWIEFQKQRGDRDLEMSAWVDSAELGFTRELKFRAEVKGSPIGPSSTRVHKVQRYRWENEQRKLCIESSLSSLDVPYGDHFTVEDRWVVTAQEDNAEKCMLQVYQWCNFTKSTWWKKTIESRAKSEGSDAVEKWLSIAKTYLQSAAPKPVEKVAKPLPHALETATNVAKDIEARNIGQRVVELYSSRDSTRMISIAIAFLFFCFFCFCILRIIQTQQALQAIDDKLNRLITQLALDSERRNGQSL
eukprot:GILJ01008629.1.p1 GENE.GILJ01008629.1~~GILJ01008629.1.p1  ORF type:complete len:495 (+),score=60.65 GILJ01008629.1:84-1487(+)